MITASTFVNAVMSTSKESLACLIVFLNQCLDVWMTLSETSPPWGLQQIEFPVFTKSSQIGLNIWMSNNCLNHLAGSLKGLSIV